METIGSSALVQLASVNILQAILENDAFGKGCISVLTLLSVSSMTLIFFKWFSVRRAARQSKAFQRIVDSDGSWEALFLASKRYRDSPMARLLKETYVECRLENWFEGKRPLDVEHRLQVAKATIEGVLNRVMSAEESRLNDKMVLIALVSSLAPFIGLLGTVWGVLGSFQAVGREGGAALSALAPGVSTALMTTVFGLFAAIPALIAHNYLSGEIHKIISRMEAFAHEVENAVRKQILFKEGRQKS